MSLPFERERDWAGLGEGAVAANASAVDAAFFLGFETGAVLVSLVARVFFAFGVVGDVGGAPDLAGLDAFFIRGRHRRAALRTDPFQFDTASSVT